MLRSFKKPRVTPPIASRYGAGGGFTLLEVLVYIAVLLLAMGATITTFFTLRDSFERARTERELTDAAVQVLERVTREVRKADNLGVGTSLPGTIILTQGTSTAEFRSNGGRVEQRLNGGSYSPISPDTVTLSNLSFYHYTNDALESEAIRTILTLSVTSPYLTMTKTFYATTVMRKTYE